MATPLPVLCFGEMLLRLASPAGEFLLQRPHLDTCFGGAEINVAVSLARLGRPSAVMTVLPDNPLGLAAIATLRGHGVDTSRVRLANGRMGLYFLTPGAASRPSEIIYDRAGSAFAEAAWVDLPWPDLLRNVAWLHVSGVTPATGPRGAEAALACMRAAVAADLPTSFDGNFRGRMWSRWGGDAAAILGELTGCAQLAFVDERDVALMLDRSFDAREPLQRRREAAAAAFERFPRLQCVASTIRAPLGANRHELSAVMINRSGREAVSPVRRLDGVVDRIGGGDAFAAGLLYARLEGNDDQVTIDFALAASCLKHSIAGDFNLATVDDIERSMSDNFDVTR